MREEELEGLQTHREQPANMLSMAPGPIFSGIWDHRPTVSSPLSSSPVRASSPLSPIDRNALPQRQTQSSPLQPPKFKFATRPTKPNPAMRKREDAQEVRRQNFLQSVRQKAEDKKFQRRDVEGFLLRQDLLEDMEQLSRGAPAFSEADIEDAMTFSQEEQPAAQQDDMMMDEEPDSDAELEAMIASYEEQHPTVSAASQEPSLSDDDFEDIFAQLQTQKQTEMTPAQMDMDDDCEMSL